MKMFKLICAAVLVCTSVNAMCSDLEELKGELKTKERLWKIRAQLDPRVIDKNSIKAEIAILKDLIHQIEYTNDVFAKESMIENREERRILFMEWFQVLFPTCNVDFEDHQAVDEVLQEQIQLFAESGIESSKDTNEGRVVLLLERYAMIASSIEVQEEDIPAVERPVVVAIERPVIVAIEDDSIPIQKDDTAVPVPVTQEEYSQEPKCSSRTRWKLCKDKTWCYFPVNAGGCRYNDDDYQVHPEDAFWYKYTSEKEDYFYCVIYENDIVSKTVKVVDMPTLPGGWQWKVWTENQIAFFPALDLDKPQWALPTEPVSRV